MQPIKLIIEIRGGNLTALLSTANLQYVVVDYDNIGNGGDPVGEPLKPDGVADDLYTFYNEPTPQDQEIREELKRIHF